MVFVKQQLVAHQDVYFCLAIVPSYSHIRIGQLYFYWSPMSVCFERIAIFYDRGWWETFFSLICHTRTKHLLSSSFYALLFLFSTKTTYFCSTLLYCHIVHRNRYTWSLFCSNCMYSFSTLLCSATFPPMFKWMCVFFVRTCIKTIQNEKTTPSIPQFDFQFILNPRAATPN